MHVMLACDLPKLGKVNLSGPKKMIAHMEELGIEVLSIKKAGKATHIFTHVEWEMQGYLIQVGNIKNINNWVCVKKEEIDRYALPSAFRSYKKELTGQ